ncbi:FAD dependent oxidoreductase-domain-containing protein [Fusarium flagelliforme]|uniref:FAD dependent oxidoreductase-domain-containing protein n=1 Tax=Fusarium flagelliforme TaxID=2675880 RepID=UPI001E8EE7F9|nr:FAD dependent oxidoreductase-domain-containing protein [Fusarium flagelliforme]KAH7184645.1 FAD dependent oxidoreductase-domain-containing protein [Fusarium flagelliforme]
MAIGGLEHSLRRVADDSLQTLKVNWHLGFTAFGGPPVHFKIFHDKFVKKLKWIDEQIYQELFSVAQALSGPASTKMLYCINLIHGGFLQALLAFLIWSIPGCFGMFGLSVGVSTIGDTLPRAVYALLSGLNAATVGVIALAAVELSDKAITDQMTRLVLSFTAMAGMMYNALWYFPALIVVAGIGTVVYDYKWLHRPARAVKNAYLRIRRGKVTETQNVQSAENGTGSDDGIQLREQETTETREAEPRVIPQEYQLGFSWKSGAAIIVTFLITFVVVVAIRGSFPNAPLLYKLFANLYLAGTIIFGGGPVVIPLLREYVVAEGWVSPRDFLIGLAIAQAFPGPNFNFAVFLGGLTAVHGGYPAIAGSLIAYLGIFVPGMVLVHGTMGIWEVLRSRRWVKIWQVGYIDEGFQAGKSLADDPWWVVVTATSFVGARYFKVPIPLAILLGACMGLVRYDESILILGGGCFGLATAFELAQKGYKNITILEKDVDVPSRFSAAYDLNKVIRAEYADDFYTQLALDAIRKWQSDPLYTPHYHQTGFLNVTSGKAAQNTKGAVESYFQSLQNNPAFNGQTTRVASSEEIKKLVPKFTGPLNGFKGYHNKLAGYGHSANALRAVYEECVKLGVKFHLGEKDGEVESLLYASSREGNKCVGARTRGGKIHAADKTIVALGADAANILPRIGKQMTGRAWGVAHIQLTDEEAADLKGIPVTNVRDLAFFFEPDMKMKKLKFCHMGGAFTNYSYTKDGLSLPFRDLSDSQFMPLEDETHIRQLLREVFPQLADRPLIDQHLCWFADTDDSDFIIDYVPDTNGTLAVLSGDSGHGFKMLPIFGEFVHKLLVDGRQDQRKWQWKDGKSKIAAVWRSSESQELAGVPRAKL